MWYKSYLIRGLSRTGRDNGSTQMIRFRDFWGLLLQPQEKNAGTPVKGAPALGSIGYQLLNGRGTGAVAFVGLGIITLVIAIGVEELDEA